MSPSERVSPCPGCGKFDHPNTSWCEPEPGVIFVSDFITPNNSEGFTITFDYVEHISLNPGEEE